MKNLSISLLPLLLTLCIISACGSNDLNSGNETAPVDDYSEIILKSEIKKSGKIALLDLTTKNNEGIGSLNGLKNGLDAAGVPYIEISNLAQAVEYPFIYTSSYLSPSTLSKKEKRLLKNYVASGGIVVSSNVSDESQFELFGISKAERNAERYEMTWESERGFNEFKYIDDPLEKNIPLGNRSKGKTIYTRGYTPGTGDALAMFDDGKAAIVRNKYIKGYAYSTGFSYTDIILRNQLDMDNSIERSYSNGFEPAVDTVILFLRAVYETHTPYPVWKHTSPGNSSSTLIITNDADSKSSMEKMYMFAELESGFGISATYNITTHYIDDSLDGDFFTPYKENIRYLLDTGQNLGSHSVGHFPDWHKETVFPAGTPGNTVENYYPAHTGGITTGGTVFGELEVSRNLILSEFGTDAKIFRSGHLLFNNQQTSIMEQLGYSFDSSFSANDLLTNFPFLLPIEHRLGSVLSSVYEIPMTISDSGLTESNYMEKVTNWLYILNKNDRNGAVTTLLIHPNREYKYLAEKAFLENIPSGINIMNMEIFGNFWKTRKETDLDFYLDKNTLNIYLNTNEIPSGFSLNIGNGENLDAVKVILKDGTSAGFTRYLVPGTADVIISF